MDNILKANVQIFKLFARNFTNIKKVDEWFIKYFIAFRKYQIF